MSRKSESSSVRPRCPRRSSGDSNDGDVRESDLTAHDPTEVMNPSARSRSVRSNRTEGGAMPSLPGLNEELDNVSSSESFVGTGNQTSQMPEPSSGIHTGDEMSIPDMAGLEQILSHEDNDEYLKNVVDALNGMHSRHKDRTQELVQLARHFLRYQTKTSEKVAELQHENRELKDTINEMATTIDGTAELQHENRELKDTINEMATTIHKHREENEANKEEIKALKTELASMPRRRKSRCN